MRPPSGWMRFPSSKFCFEQMCFETYLLQKPSVSEHCNSHSVLSIAHCSCSARGKSSHGAGWYVHGTLMSEKRSIRGAVYEVNTTCQPRPNGRRGQAPSLRQAMSQCAAARVSTTRPVGGGTHLVCAVVNQLELHGNLLTNLHGIGLLERLVRAEAPLLRVRNIAVL